MRTSTERLLTTHVGSLPDAPGLNPETAGHEEALDRAVAEVIAQQRENGLNVSEARLLSPAGLHDRLI